MSHSKRLQGKIGFIKEVVFPSVVYMVAKRLLDENYNFPTYMVLPVIITITISSKVIGALDALFFNESFCRAVIRQLAVIRHL